MNNEEKIIGMLEQVMQAVSIIEQKFSVVEADHTEIAVLKAAVTQLNKEVSEIKKAM